MLKRLNNIFLFLIVLFYGCSNQEADKIFRNGMIYTMNDFQPTAEAVAIKNGKIIHVGYEKNVNKYIGSETEIFDLHGKTMVPGLIEGHGHFMGLGYAKMNLDLNETRSYSDLIDMVEYAVKNSKPGEWIIGRGWHQSKWTDSPNTYIKGFQTHDRLSKVSPNNPVWLKHASGHAGFANLKAMEIARVTSETEFGFGGEVIKDISGSPTGIFNERAQKLINRHVSTAVDEDSNLNKNQKAISLAVKECLKNGITSFQDAGTGGDEITSFRQAIKNGTLKTRLYVMLSSGDANLLDDWYKKGPEIGTANNFLTIRSIKLNADGALGSRGAWLLDEYSDRPGHFGMATQSMEYVYQVAMEGIKSGFQINTHAIGDRTNRETLDQYEKVFEQFPKKSIDHRWRIEHAQHIDPNDIPRFGEMGVIPSIQAIHMSSDRPWAINRLGLKRIKESAYVWRDLINNGAILINGTDVPVEPLNPIASFYASVSRKTLKGLPSGGYEPSQKLTRIEALKSYTINAAFGAFENDIKGTIENGKYADFTILSRNIITVPEDQILGTTVLFTIINGKIEYKLN